MAGHIATSKRDTWCTPPSVLAPVRETFGGTIDLDPCWNPNAITEPLVGFDYERRGEDGLTQPWDFILGCRTRVFVNPPFGRALPAWVDKAIAEARKGAEIIMLLPAAVDTKHFRRVAETASEIAFWRGRIRFLGAAQGAPMACALAYWNPRSPVIPTGPTRFERAFSPVAWVVPGGVRAVAA